MALCTGLPELSAGPAVTGCPDAAPQLRGLVGVLGHGSKVTQGQVGVDPVGGAGPESQHLSARPLCGLGRVGPAATGRFRFRF